MKYLLSFLMVSFLASATLLNAQESEFENDAITKYFDKYMDDPRFDMVYVSPKMFQLVSKIEVEEMDPEISEMISNLKGLRILSLEDAADAPKYYKEAKTKIDTRSFETLMTARDGNENVDVLVKDNGNIVSELLVIVGGHEEFVLISFVGDIDLKKIGKMAKMLDIDHMDKLEKIEEKEEDTQKY